MVHGSFNPATAIYENSARLFFVRLLDSTQVAIEVGRERMGTDKRPGTIDLTPRDDKSLLWSKTVPDTRSRTSGSSLPTMPGHTVPKWRRRRRLPASRLASYPLEPNMSTRASPASAMRRR